MSRTPRICFVAPKAYPVLAGDDRTEFIGGAELQQVIVARELVRRGYSVSMICLDFGQPDNVQMEGVTVFRAYKRDTGIPIVRYVWPRLTSMWQALARADADIYYQRTAGFLTGIVAQFCRRHGKASIFAAAGNPDLELNTPRIRFARDRWIYEYGLRRVDRIVVQNNQQRELCRKNFGRDADLIPNCYPKQSGDVSGGPGRVLWVSTMRKLKRPDLFLDLAAGMPEVQFRMVGGPGLGEEKFFEQIKARASELPNLEFRGFVTYPGVEKYFDDACLLVNTSESEGFPNTFLQAWSRGIPTVSFVDCGARLDGEPVGRQAGSAEEMASIVRRLVEAGPERSSEGIRCKRYFDANHGPDRVLGLYETLFRELLQKGV